MDHPSSDYFSELAVFMMRLYKLSICSSQLRFSYRIMRYLMDTNLFIVLLFGYSGVNLPLLNIV